MEGLATGSVPRSTTLEFWIKDDDDGLRKVTALLPASGYLGELFHAFGLITKEQLESEAARSQAADVNFLQWLQSTVQEAVFVGQQHDDLKQRIREKRTVIEHSFGLASLVVRGAAMSCCLAADGDLGAGHLRMRMRMRRPRIVPTACRQTVPRRWPGSAPGLPAEPPARPRAPARPPARPRAGGARVRDARGGPEAAAGGAQHP